MAWASFINLSHVPTFMRKLPILILALIVVAGGLLVGFQSARVSDDSDVGGRARDLVKGSFLSIVFEIDYFAVQPEIVPSHTEVDRFLTFVMHYTGKSASAEYQELPASLATTGHWDEKSLHALDSKTRDMHSWPFYQLSVHIIYANALFESPNAAAASIGATTIVLFKGIFAFTSPGAEDAVLSHEFGHLMGLCGLVTPDQKNICDGTGHALDPASLMAAKIVPYSPWVTNLELQPDEVAMLNSL